MRRMRNVALALVVSGGLMIGTAAAQAVTLEPVETASETQSVTQEGNVIEVEVGDASSRAYGMCGTRVYRTLNNALRGSALVPARDGSTSCYLEKQTINRWTIATEALQYGLKNGGGYSIAIDGYYGAATESAVRSVQKKSNLAQDGVYGPATGSQMTWYSVVGGKGKWA